MAAIYFPLVLPTSLVADIDRRAKACKLARSAFLVKILSDNLNTPDLTMRLPLGSLRTGPAARGTSSTTVSLLVSAALKQRLLSIAEQWSTTQAAVCRALILREFHDLQARESGAKPPEAVTVTVPSLDTSDPASVEIALDTILRQVCLYGRPAKDVFGSSENREKHLMMLSHFTAILAALYGHKVRLTEPDMEFLFAKLGVQQAIMFSSIMNFDNTMQILAKASVKSDEQPTVSPAASSPTSPPRARPPRRS